MRTRPLLASIVCAGILAARSAAGQGSEPSALYALIAPPSQFEWGCYGPCDCAVIVQSGILGTFVLTRSRTDPLFTSYDVTDVRWNIQSPSGPMRISGSGTYRRGGEVAITEQLELDLSLDQEPPLHFDSGVRSPGAMFPEIRTSVSLHFELQCMDTVLRLDAKPVGWVSAPGSRSPLSLVVNPNPAAGSSALVFTLPSDAVVDLGVFDLAGRRVRALEAHERLPGGAHFRSWDGRGDNGEPLSPGLYLVRLDTPGARLTRVAVRVK